MPLKCLETIIYKVCNLVSMKSDPKEMKRIRF